ncbi:MAG: ribonuclease G [Porticoccaceae bacterium]|nr:ribonuclease G [Gammaproteobacteria bacterium]TAL07932.1 MAG: ribonuclease G [Porticoccaceae bacterium]
MSGEILINITPSETRVARVDNGVLQEISIERAQKRGLVGNIYKGKVVRVMPGMQAAFIDIGRDKAGFIHINDLRPRAGETVDRWASGERDIRDLLREGDLLAVQALKDPIGTKGPRLTTFLSVSSRLLVFMPKTDHIGISQRIEDEAERERLRQDLELAIAGHEVCEEPSGYIIRTVAEGATREELSAEVAFLHRLWAYVKDKIASSEAVGCLYEDLPLTLRTLRDLNPEGIDRIRVDSDEVFDLFGRFTTYFNSEVRDLIERYRGERPLFSLYGVEEEISRALERRVDLKSGGYLVIDQNEAMTTIDVNTGSYTGRHNLEQTIFKTNVEAAGAIARQIRLRNLGGIIILDFIDMQDPEHRRQVLRALENALANDRAKLTISGVSQLGLVEMTRKRTHENLQQQLCEPCGVCNGRGYMKSPETVTFEIFREILREARTFECEKIRVMAAHSVIDRLLAENSTDVADLEAFIKRPIEFRVESVYSQEQFDIVPL